MTAWVKIYSPFSQWLFQTWHLTCVVLDGDVLVLNNQQSLPSFCRPLWLPPTVLTNFGASLLALLGGAAVGLANTGSVGVGQQTTPSISTTSQIDPSSIERAYAALGLTYQGNQMQTQSQAQVKNQQQGQSPQGLRPMNPMSKLICHC